jgi:uncharacterized protein YciI
MLYVIYAEDVANSLEKRRETRPAHLERLQKLKDAGRLVLAGPNPAIDSEDPGEAGMTGSVVIAEFDNLAQATQWADADPYMLGGVYQKVTVKPFKRTV